MHVLILGDVMLDRYLRGEVRRISPEAPVPVLDLQQTESRLGGAGNVALNIRSLGATPLLCSVVGQDEEGQRIVGHLQHLGLEAGGILASAARRTTVKIRLLAEGQHLLRVDKEDRFALKPEEESRALSQIKQMFREKQADVVLFQDYDKGYLTPSLIAEVLALAKEHDLPTVVDPKFRHFYAYEGVSLFKPNLKEVQDRVPFAVEPDLKSLERAAAYLQERLGFDYILITLSEHGAFMAGKGESLLAPAEAREIADVCGAGDAVVSVVTLGLAAGLGPADLIKLANAAGGQVCRHVGVVAVRPADLQLALNSAKW